MRFCPIKDPRQRSPYDVFSVFYPSRLLVVWRLHGCSLFLGEAAISKPRNRKLAPDSGETVVRRKLQTVIQFRFKVWGLSAPDRSFLNL